MALLTSSATETLPGGRLAEGIKTIHGSYKNQGSDVLWVDWEGPADPLNPKNWAYRKKWAATVIVSLFAFISPVSSSMVAPATFQIVKEFGVKSSVVEAMMTSVFVLGYGFGPMLLAPLSEIFGRSAVLQLSNLFYLIFNIGCGFAQNKGQLIAFRFLSGLGGSAPQAVGGGVLGDIWHAEERGRASSIYSLAPFLGPVLGPICGSWIAERSTWRWVFWSTSIVDVAIQVAGLFFLKETYAPYLLEKKANRIISNMDLEIGPIKQVRSVYETKGNRHWKDVFRKALIRPFALFAYEPIVQILSLYMALIYGIFYLYLTTIPAIFTRTYGMDIGIAGLNYIALGIGLTGASQINARYMDRVYIWLKERRGKGVGEPEFRLPSMVPGTIILPVGLLLGGWAAQQKFHWIVTDIGTVIVGVGGILTFQSIQAYVLDTFTLHAASALAATSLLRSFAGFGFPLFAPEMYANLGYGKGGTVLACAAIALGCPTPFLLWFYGKKIRMMSRYARKPQRQLYVSSKHEAPKQPGTAEIADQLLLTTVADAPSPINYRRSSVIYVHVPTDQEVSIRLSKGYGEHKPAILEMAPE
ncbi:MFS polyamine transporter [Macrolepiota fuliginosa MF-IS2]|uniref:MFS polyamine transporter n=1 Tax=Macrolepiota fuliginosa MF-IS2 TaxID=1400762 RepID=A0A9P5X5A4_9AGAR|nr:MFS polyamine transporter [Macrolepiota fuliginosa MF-IS2]